MHALGIVPENSGGGPGCGSLLRELHITSRRVASELYIPPRMIASRTTEAGKSGGPRRLPLGTRGRASIALAIVFGLAAGLGACGTQGIQLPKASPYYKGAVLFRDHCSGCHTLAVVGAEGSATSIKDRLKTNGPNFNVRKEDEEQVLYAIRNGGFTGAIMPENIVVGSDAKEIAGFLAKYSGLQAPKVPSVEIKLSEK